MSDNEAKQRDPQAYEVLACLAESYQQDRQGRREATRALLKDFAELAEAAGFRVRLDLDNEGVQVYAADDDVYGYVLRERSSGDFVVAGPDKQRKPVPLRYNPAKTAYEGVIISTKEWPQSRRSALSELAVAFAGVMPKPR